MPLPFLSLSHGWVAFGFFNIESDLLLLDNYFLFASDFCSRIMDLASLESGYPARVTWKVYILKPEDMGDLHGAIRGDRLAGFMGDIYRIFPFPKNPLHFRQNPEGYKNRGTVEMLIQKYSGIFNIPIKVEKTGKIIQIGEYLLSRECWGELLTYVWAGGYPRWKEGIRPEYVIQMKEEVEKSGHPLFKGIILKD